MAVNYVVNASLDENGHISGGNPGDQTGREVRVQPWYNRPWNVMLRCPSPTLAALAATSAAKLANSNLVGYNQDRRNTLYNRLRDYNFDVDAYIASGIKTECDCSSFVYACYAVAMPAIRYNGNAPTTSTMRNFFTGYGFTAYTASMYLDGPTYLIDGDILLYEGHHTVIAYDGYIPPPSPSHPGDLLIKKKEVSATIGADSFNKAFAGTYKADTEVYIRNGPSVIRKALAVIPENATVYNFGYYSGKKSNPWLYCQVKIGDTIYTGHVKGKYLIKVK